MGCRHFHVPAFRWTPCWYDERHADTSPRSRPPARGGGGRHPGPRAASRPSSSRPAHLVQHSTPPVVVCSSGEAPPSSAGFGDIRPRRRKPGTASSRIRRRRGVDRAARQRLRPPPTPSRTTILFSSASAGKPAGSDELEPSARSDRTGRFCQEAAAWSGFADWLAPTRPIPAPTPHRGDVLFFGHFQAALSDHFERASSRVDLEARPWVIEFHSCHLEHCYGESAVEVLVRSGRHRGSSTGGCGVRRLPGLPPSGQKPLLP